MTALTFETIAHDGVIDLPAGQYGLNGKTLKVIIMDDSNDYEAVLEDLQDTAAPMRYWAGSPRARKKPTPLTKWSQTGCNGQLRYRKPP